MQTLSLIIKKDFSKSVFAFLSQKGKSCGLSTMIFGFPNVDLTSD